MSPTPLPGRRDIPRCRGAASARAGFTVVEVSVAFFILLLIFLVSFTFFSGEQRQVQALSSAHDLNAIVEKGFRQLSRDIRSASAVREPGLMEPADAPPAFEYETNSACVLEHKSIDFASRPVSEKTSVVRYFLGNPEEVADLEGGETATIYDLFKEVDGNPVPPDREPVLSGIEELTFYRTTQKPGSSGLEGTGFYVLHMRLKVSAIRRGTGRRFFRGYGVEMETMIRLRGGL